MLRNQQPNVIFLPLQPNQYIISNLHNSNDHSPIKTLKMMDNMQNAMQEYLSLFNDNFDNKQQSSSSQSSSKKHQSRKLNMGEKVKSKFQSTATNKMQAPMLLFSLRQTSPFMVQSQYKQEQKLYSSNSDSNKCQTYKKSQVDSNNKSPKNWKDKLIQNYMKKSDGKVITRENRQNSCENQSPYTFNNISAKTYESSPFSAQNQNSPINGLRNFQSLQMPISAIRKVNLISQIYPQYIPLIRLKSAGSNNHHNNDGLQNIAGNSENNKKKQNIDIKNVPLANSRVLEVGQFQYQSPKHIQSVCIPCQKSSQQNLSGYEYALSQLQKLKQNVSELETAADNLMACKIIQFQSSIILPSPIFNKQYVNKQSFIHNLEQNLRQVFAENDKQSLLIKSGFGQNNMQPIRECDNICQFLTPLSKQQQNIGPTFENILQNYNLNKENQKVHSISEAWSNKFIKNKQVMTTKYLRINQSHQSRKSQNKQNKYFYQ